MVADSSLLDYYERTHARRVYGTSSVKYVRHLKPWIDVREPASILDYGCGQSMLLEALAGKAEIELRRYDPAIPEFREPPAARSDLLICIDVLEHIEEADLDATLAQMRDWSREAIIVVDTVPAKHTLPDGRNAHVTLKSHDWWQARIERVFGLAEPVDVPRRSRAAFRTFACDQVQLNRYRRRRFMNEIAHNVRRLARLHKRAWKVSSTRRKDAA